MLVALLACVSPPPFSSPPVEYQGVTELVLVHLVEDRERLYVELPDLDHSLWFVDTGYSSTTCDTQWVASQGYGLRPVLAWSRGEHGAVRLQKAVLPSFMLGGHRIERLSCAVRDLQATSSITDQRVAGVLGTNLLRRFTVVLDMEEGVLRLHDPEELRVEAGDRLRLEFGTGRPRVRLELDEQTLWPLLDTGATGTYLHAEKLGLDFRAERQSTWSASGADPHQEQTLRYYTAAGPRLAGCPGPDELWVVDRPRRWDDGLVGMSLLENYTLTLDYRRRRVLAEPAQPAELPVR